MVRPSRGTSRLGQRSSQSGFSIFTSRASGSTSERAIGCTSSASNQVSPLRAPLIPTQKGDYSHIQRHSQVSLAGGLTELQGGINLIPIVTAKGTAQPRGGSNFLSPPLAPPWLRAWSRLFFPPSLHFCVNLYLNFFKITGEYRNISFVKGL